ncbi:MAG: glycosyltransferase family 2 protein [Clostridia bacterium]|nr:glycosyltransferase family 2 protein [Clostridia bacterium]
MKPVISIVTPAYNEQESLPAFLEKVTSVMESSGLSYEIIIVNDGSKDDTQKILKAACEKDKRIKGVNLSRNFGQMPAIFCGMSKSKGDAVVVLDADLQDTPETVLDMIAKWKEGYEVVNAARTARKGEGFLKKFTSKAFIRTTNKLSGLNMPEDSGEFKLYDRKVVDALLSLPENSRYLRAQVAWLGFKQGEVPFERQSRAAGKTKYSLKKMLALAETAIVPNSPSLLKFSGIIGLSAGFLSVAAFIAFGILAAFKVFLPLTAWLFPFIGLNTSFILLSITVAGKYIRFMYDDVKKRPVFVVGEEYNLEETDG